MEESELGVGDFRGRSGAEVGWQTLWLRIRKIHKVLLDGTSPAT
jgi:hypothetical protein